MQQDFQIFIGRYTVRMSNNIVEAAMAKNSWSGSDLALLAQQGPQQLQLHAEKIRQLELSDDDAVHLVLFKM
jgi:hypothetical protein